MAEQQDISLSETLRKLADLDEQVNASGPTSAGVYYHPQTAEEFVRLVRAIGGGEYKDSSSPYFLSRVGNADVYVFVPIDAMIEKPTPRTIDKRLKPAVVALLALADDESAAVPA